MKRLTLHSLVRSLMRLITKTEYRNLEYLPEHGPMILAINHLSRFDIPLLFVVPTRQDMTALATTKYKRYPLIRWFIDSAEGIWLDRDTADFTAFRTATEALKKGQALGIAPEGTRSLTGGLLEGKPGAVLLAIRSGVPILPVGITGTENTASDFKHFRKPHMMATFGEPFEIPVIDRENREESLKQATNEVMCRIAVLLPEKYRGFYKDFPRVKELLDMQGGEVKIHSVRRL